MLVVHSRAPEPSLMAELTGVYEDRWGMWTAVQTLLPDDLLWACAQHWCGVCWCRLSSAGNTSYSIMSSGLGHLFV